MELLYKWDEMLRTRSDSDLFCIWLTAKMALPETAVLDGDKEEDEIILEEIEHEMLKRVGYE